jgi:hypothetical protein
LGLDDVNPHRAVQGKQRSHVASCEPARRSALLSVAAGALGGGAGGGATSGAFAMESDGKTVAFDSIDGPPAQVFEEMVRVLDRESKLRNLSIVSRDLSGCASGAWPHHDRLDLGRL